jgi:hypothetical protein
MLGRDVVVKVRELGPGDRIKVALGAGRGRRHWKGAAWLMKHGIATARPYVLAIEARRPTPREWLVLESLAGKTLLQHIADRDLTVREEHEVARRIARQMYAIGSAGRYNRDHKPSNLILVRRPDGYAPALIDCVGLRGEDSLYWRMLHGLSVEPKGLGILPRRALQARVVDEYVRAELEAETPGSMVDRMDRRKHKRILWDIVADSLARHGDPTPRTNPLVGRGGALR